MPRARLVLVLVLVLVPDCGHWAQLERHDEFLAQVLTFLSGTDRESRPG